MSEVEARSAAEKLLGQRFLRNAHFLGTEWVDEESGRRLLGKEWREGKLGFSGSEYRRMMLSSQSSPAIRPRWVVCYLLIGDEFRDGFVPAYVSVDDETGEAKLYIHSRRASKGEKGE